MSALASPPSLRPSQARFSQPYFAALLDCEGALHALGAMRIDAAVIRVGAGLEILGQARGAARDLAGATDLVAARVLDAEVVGDRGVVGEVERVAPRLRRQRALGEREGPARVRGHGDGPAAPRCRGRAPRACRA